MTKYTNIIVIFCFVQIAKADETFKTANFVVYAPTNQIAEQFGKMAEHHRKSKAVEWLGQEIPKWQKPCNIFIIPELAGASGYTKFNYDFRGNYEVTEIRINGALNRLLENVLPHEITHIIFAHYFRFPVPRWADEGGAVFSENAIEHEIHDQICYHFLDTKKLIPLRRLFQLKEYNEVNEIMIIYAEGYSISDYLIKQKDHKTFLAFVAAGMRGNWDNATQIYYQLQSVEELEIVWLKHIKFKRAIRSIFLSIFVSH